MKILGLQTARAGSKSVKNKNIAMVKDKPLFMHNLEAMLDCKLISDIALSTNIESILNLKRNRLSVIKRPSELATDNASHTDAMRHAVDYMEAKTAKTYDYIVLTLGNSLGCNELDLSDAIESLLTCPEIDSVMSVSKFNMFNPNRAFRICDSSLISPYINQSQMSFLDEEIHVNDKDSAGDIYFFNGSFMIFKKNCLYSEKGLNPFPWLGHKISHFIQETQMEVDAMWQLDYISNRVD